MESGGSFWFATGRAPDEKVEVGIGPLGGKAAAKLVTWAQLNDEVADRLDEGFSYMDAPYRRMSAEALAQLGAGAASSTQPKPAAPAPAPPSPNFAPSAAQAALGEPWSLVCSLTMLRDGTTVNGYAALDASGDKLFDFDPQGGVDFAREHDLDIAFA